MASEQELNNIIENSVIWAAGAGVIPIPIGDFIAVTAIQMDMLKRLSKALGKDHEEISARSFILALNGGFSARIGASLIKALPGVGSILGGISMPIMAGTSTYAVGNLFVKYITSYGSLNDIDLSEAKRRFKDLYDKGKEKMEGVQDDIEDIEPEDKE